MSARVFILLFASRSARNSTVWKMCGDSHCENILIHDGLLLYMISFGKASTHLTNPQLDESVAHQAHLIYEPNVFGAHASKRRSREPVNLANGAECVTDYFTRSNKHVYTYTIYTYIVYIYYTYTHLAQRYFRARECRATLVRLTCSTGTVE